MKYGAFCTNCSGPHFGKCAECKRPSPEEIRQHDAATMARRSEKDAERIEGDKAEDRGIGG